MARKYVGRAVRKADSAVERITGVKVSSALRDTLAARPGGREGCRPSEALLSAQRVATPRGGAQAGSRALVLPVRPTVSGRTEPLTVAELLERVAAFEGVLAYYHETKTDILRIATLAQSSASAVMSCVLFAQEEGFDLAPVPLKRGHTPPMTISAIQKELLDQRASRFQFVDSRTLSTPFSVQLEAWEITDDGHLGTPRNNNLASRVWHYVEKEKSAAAVDLHEFLPGKPLSEVQFEIDWVFTWVNGQDPDWQEMYRQYAPEVQTDASDGSRFEHRDDLLFALRSLDEYAPWIRRIHVVSNCKPPAWLNLENPRVNWVWHEDLFDAEELPTFSSHAIETTLHRIPGLSEHFVYSNDDFYLARRASPADFFASNGTCLTKFEGWGMVSGEAVEGDADHLNAARNSSRLLLEDFGGWPVNLHTHSPQSLRVSILREMEERYPEEFQSTRASRFRSASDIAVSGFLFHHYAFATGRGVPVDPRTQLVQQNHKFNDVFATLLRDRDRWSGSPKLSFCVNDGRGSMKNSDWNASALRFLCEYFPTKSQFEN